VYLEELFPKTEQPYKILAVPVHGLLPCIDYESLILLRIVCFPAGAEAWVLSGSLSPGHHSSSTWSATLLTEASFFLPAFCNWLLPAGAEAWVLSGSPEVTQYLGMRSSKKRSISIGGVKTAWLKYEVRDQRQQQQQQQERQQQEQQQQRPQQQQQQQQQQRPEQQERQQRQVRQERQSRGAWARSLSSAVEHM
jgi:hypothetical protein